MGKTANNNQGKRFVTVNTNQVNEFVKDRLLVYLKKNKDYGDSFLKSVLRFGDVSAFVRIEDKVNRYTSLYNKDGEVEDESINDTLLDLFNYTMMFKAYKEDGARILIDDLARVMTAEANYLAYADIEGDEVMSSFIWEMLSKNLDLTDFWAKRLLINIKGLINYKI